ncbi:hypothetical protein HOG98_05255 [bacterium]|nr:hypothetical protein [bacterium]
MIAIFWPNITEYFHSEPNKAPSAPSSLAVSIADKTHTHIKYMLDSKMGSYAYKLIVLPKVKQKSEKSQTLELTPNRTKATSVQKLVPVVTPIKETFNTSGLGQSDGNFGSILDSKKAVIKRSLPGFPVYLSSLKQDSSLASDEINLEAKHLSLRGDTETVVENENIYYNQTVTSTEVKAGELEFLEIQLLVASDVLKEIGLSTENLESFLEKKLTIQESFDYKMNITEQKFHGFSYQIGSFLNKCERYATSRGIPIWLVIVAASILFSFSSFFINLLREANNKKRKKNSESVDPLSIPSPQVSTQKENVGRQSNDGGELQITDKETALIKLVEQKPKAIATLILGWVDA